MQGFIGVTALILCSFTITYAESDVSIRLQQDTPHLFEGIPLNVLCTVDNRFQSQTWLKDNISIISYVGKDIQVDNLPKFTKSSVFSLPSNSFYFLTFENLTRMEHSGIYECVGMTDGGDVTSAEYALSVDERMPICLANKQNTLEYLVGEKLVLSCYNPIYREPTRRVKWYRSEDRSEALERERTEDEFSAVDNATLSIKAEMNGTSFICIAETDDNPQTTSNLSCTLGPVVVYNSPFISIIEINPGSTSSNRTFSCRITPWQTNVGTIEWLDVPTNYVIASTNETSYITFTDLSSLSNLGREINISCVGTAYGMNLSTSYIFSVSSSPTAETPGLAIPLFTLILISVAVLVSIFLICVFIIICFTIRKCRKSKDSSEGSKMAETNEFVSFPPAKDSDMMLTTLPDGRYQLRPHHVSITSVGSADEDTERSPLTPLDEDLYDLPPVAQLP